MGHSFGATVALRVAHRYPNFVKSLSLIEPVFFAAAFADYHKLKDQFMSDHADYFKAGLDENWDLAAKLFLKLWGNNENWELLNESKKDNLLKEFRLPLKHLKPYIRIHMRCLRKKPFRL